MEAQQLIRSASYDPDALSIIFKAFDDAWHEVRPSVSDDEMAVEAAKLSLANILLSLAREDSRDFKLLTGDAVRAFRLTHGCSRDS